MKLNFQLSKAVNIIVLITFIIALLYLGRTILVPLTFGIVFSLLLYPLTSFFEDHHVPRIISIIITFVIVFLVITGIIAFFSSQVVNLFDDIKNFGQMLENLATKLIKLLNDALPFEQEVTLRSISDSGDILSSSRNIISKTIVSSTTFITFSIFIIVYTFLFLLYRSSFKRFFIMHFTDENKDTAASVINKIQKVAQHYFYGLFVVILIVGTLNGFGLWIIGLDYPFLFGYLAAFLTIIPYLGTTIGGSIPFLYALINYDSIWVPVAVVALYVSVQTLEGNILTPKIVGASVSLNPLFALISLILGGMIWGIAGMILFIPLMAVLKVVFDNVESLQPYGLLLSSNFASNKEDFIDKLNMKIGRVIKKIKNDN